MNDNDATETLDQAELVAVGEAQVAYIKAISSEDVQRLFPQAPQLRPGLKLFALLSGDGTPILLTETREAAVANAWANDIETVSVH
jgi:hypothetical protein